MHYACAAMLAALRRLLVEKSIKKTAPKAIQYYHNLEVDLRSRPRLLKTEVPAGSHSKISFLSHYYTFAFAVLIFRATHASGVERAGASLP
jgi:hypothetical protein